MKANQPLTFDFALAETAKTAFTHAGNALDNQASSRNSALQTAMNEFAGYFSTIYNRNSTIAANDAGELAERFRQIATQIGKIIDSAHRENENRRKAREWDERNEWEDFGTASPVNSSTTIQKPLQTLLLERLAFPKELPPLGSAGDNSSERDWLATLANAFERAGGRSASLVSLSNSALQTALDQAGKSTSERQNLSIDPPTVEGAIPTSGFANDPVNAATGNFVELENDLPFIGIAQSLSLTRMFN